MGRISKVLLEFDNAQRYLDCILGLGRLEQDYGPNCPTFSV